MTPDELTGVTTSCVVHSLEFGGELQSSAGCFTSPTPPTRRLTRGSANVKRGTQEKLIDGPDSIPCFGLDPRNVLVVISLKVLDGDQRVALIDGHKLSYVLYRHPDSGTHPGRQSAAAQTSTREREIANLIAAGVTNAEIAERLTVSARA